MRKFIGNVALEEEELQQQEQAQAEQAEAAEREEAESISLEEEALIIADAGVDLAETATELAETDRIIEVSDALEDMAVVADEIKEATPVEVQLIETVGTMAVAGTDIAPEEVVPALEGIQDLKPQMEKVRATAKRIWEQILKFLESVWTKIEAFFYKQFGTIPALQKRLNALLKKAEEAAKGESAAQTITIKGGVGALSVNGKVPASEGELSQGVNALTEAAKFVYGTYSDGLAKRGEVIAHAIGDFDPNKAELSAQALKQAIRNAKFGDIPGAAAGSKARYPGFSSRLGKPLPGNVSLVSKYYIDQAEDASILAGLDRARREGVDLVATNPGAAAPAGATEMKTISTSGAVNLIKDTLDLLKVIEEFKRGGKSKAIQKARKDIESASAKATKAIESAKPSADGPQQNLGTSVVYYRAMLNFNAAFARWSRDPAASFTSSALSTARAIAVVVDKSLSTYKVAAPAAAAAAAA
jgi:hypothetical protein